MDQLSLSTERQLQSLTVLANANELTTRIIHKVVGNDISDTMNGVRVSREVVGSLIQNRYRIALTAGAK